MRIHSKITYFKRLKLVCLRHQVTENSSRNAVQGCNVISQVADDDISVDVTLLLVLGCQLNYSVQFCAVRTSCRQVLVSD